MSLTPYVLFLAVRFYPLHGENFSTSMEVVVKTARLSKLTILVIVSFVFVQEENFANFLLQRGGKTCAFLPGQPTFQIHCLEKLSE